MYYPHSALPATTSTSSEAASPNGTGTPEAPFPSWFFGEGWLDSQLSGGGEGAPGMQMMYPPHAHHAGPYHPPPMGFPMMPYPPPHHFSPGMPAPWDWGQGQG